MVDLAYPVRALGGQISHLHQYLKNVESYHFGKLYTIAYDDYVDYYLVQGPAKRVFNWIADNQKATYTIGAGIIAALILYYAHPLRTNINSSTDPDAANAPDGVEGEEVGGAPAGDEEIHSDHEQEVGGPRRRKRPEGAGGSLREESLEGAEGEREVDGSDHEEENDGTNGAEGSADKKPAASTNAKGAAAAILDSLLTEEDDEASGAEDDASKPANPAKAPATLTASAAKAAASSKPAASTNAKAATAILEPAKEGDDISGTEDARKPSPTRAKAPATPAAPAAKGAAAAAKAPATATSDNKDAAPSAAEAKASAKPSAPAAVPAVNADAK